MDTLTHALSGVLAARCIGRPVDPRTNRARLIAAGVAAAFPDIDYALVLVDPLWFLVLHRGPTHSLVLLPLWAALLAVPLRRALRLDWNAAVTASTLGLLMHIAGDWVTVYGTQLFYPLSDHAYALGVSFDMNPWIAVVVMLGFVLGTAWRVRAIAVTTLAAVIALLTGQAALRQQALLEAGDQPRGDGPGAHAIHALPQPLSPFHWALLVSDGGGYRLAYLDLLDGARSAPAGMALLTRMYEAYRPGHDLVWTHYADPGTGALAREAWQQPVLEPFRRFARFPALLGLEQRADETCVWFTDLRHKLPVLPAAFRYGVCRTRVGTPWLPYRLRYLTVDTRQALW